MEVQNRSLETQLKTTNERQPDITPFHDQACLIRRKIHPVQLSLIEDIYKVKHAEIRLNEIEEKSLSFMEGLLEVGKKVQSQLTWVEANSNFPKHLPQKTAVGLKIELELLEFQRKSSVRLRNGIVKTLEKCT